MVNSILSTPQETVLENALSASATRHKLISNNIANVNTPGFKRSDLAFEDVLTETMNQGQSQLSRTNIRHLAGQPTGAFGPQVISDPNSSVRTDGNNVDIDIEMAGLAKNTLYYQSVAQTLGSYFSNLLTAIKGQ
ncbi:MAG: flagellar basal body rod protein FlgB [Negativicutes bacterium]|nr:flagellar basal body rod protein FlgB [Negativicutes bacterium]